MMTDALKERLAEEVDLTLAMAGEQVDGEKAHAACLRLLDTDDFREGPTSRADLMAFIRRLSDAVLGEIGAEVPQQEIQRVPDVGKWSNEGPGPDVILPGSGKIIG